MAIITLLTDFGTADEYVGIMKGVILSINPSATIVDISHEVDAQDIVQAAYLITSYYRYFPLGTIHITVVDPGVGSQRNIVVADAKGHRFISPDNGILTLLIREGWVESSFCMDNPDYFLKPVSRTFHGRDIFAPLAAHLSLGVDVGIIGKPMKPECLCTLEIQQPGWVSGEALTGIVIAIDRFGNLITNIEEETLDRFCIENRSERIEITINDQSIFRLSSTYESNPSQDPLGIIGSRGYLEIAVNKGSAQRYFNAGKGDRVRISSDSVRKTEDGRQRAEDGGQKAEDRGQ